MTQKVLSGVLHNIPADLRKALTANQIALKAWNNITPLARNEWICWIISVKKIETRKNHIERTCMELLQGKRRPCCWSGCKHR